MKIYEQKPTHLVRIQISKIGDNTQYLTFCETTPPEVEEMCKSVIEAQKLSPFASGNKTRIDIRESWGGKNGKSKSISFRGLDTKTTLELIINHVKVERLQAPLYNFYNG
jgi:hypothetical protein